MENTRERAIQAVQNILQENPWVREDDGEYQYEIFPGSYDETILGNGTLKNIAENEDPKLAFSDCLYEMAEEYKYSYGIPFLMDELESEFHRKGLQDVYAENENDIRQFITENVHYYYDEKQFNQNLNVTIQLDTGDLNYDFTKCNILNYYSHYEDGGIPEESPILWLCRQMEEEDGLRKVVEYYHDDRNDIPHPEVSPFIESVEAELLNGASHMLQLTFLFQMGLQDYLSLKDAISKEKDLNCSYHLFERSGNGAVTVSRRTTCGLMDFWSGGGSLFEINLPKDLEIPIRTIQDAAIDDINSRYGVQEVYGFTGKPWRSGEILNIRPHTDHELRCELPAGAPVAHTAGRAEKVLPIAKKASKTGMVKVYDLTDGNREFATFINGREYTYGYNPSAARRAEEKARKKKSI